MGTGSLRFYFGLGGLALLAACSSAAGDGPCSTSADCETGEACVDETCVERVDAGDGGPTGCLFDEQCLTPHACVDARCLDGVCFLRGRDGECGLSETCNVDEGCLGGTDPDAGVADAAGPDAGRMADAAPPADGGLPDASPMPDGSVPGNLGASCERDRDCDPIAGREAFCLDGGEGFIGRRFVNGHCTVLCTDETRNPCGPDGVCWERIGPAYCVATCAVDRDCRQEDGYECVPPTSSSEGPTLVCLPATFG